MTPKPDSGSLLLDTHVWVWLALQEKVLATSRALLPIEKAVRNSQVGISAISVWELGMLVAKGRIQLPTDCLEWVHEALSLRGIFLIPITPEIAIESSRLPQNFHGDPADQILVATARHKSMTLVTKDGSIIRYGKQHLVKVLEV